MAHGCSGMPAVPTLAAVAAVIGIEPDDPADADDLALQADLLAHRARLVEQASPSRPGSTPHRRRVRTCTSCAISNPGAAR